jgi:hypothetical protein
MTKKEKKKLSQAIDYLGAEHNDYEAGMKILYNLLGQQHWTDKINWDNVKTVDIMKDMDKISLSDPL